MSYSADPLSGIDVTQSALLLIDVQNGFVSDYSQRCLPHIFDAVERYDFGLVLATQFINVEDSQFRRLMNWNKLQSKHDIALLPPVENNADYIIKKSTYGAGDRIAELLRQHDVSTVVIMGIDTVLCVLQNAAQLFDLGFVPVVDLRGCASNGGPEADHAAIRLMERTVGKDQVIRPSTV